MGKCLNKLKLDIRIYSSQDLTIALCLVRRLALISFFCFLSTYHVITCISSRVSSLYCIMIDQINELPEDGLKSSPETLRYIEDTWFNRKIKISYTLLHLITISINLKWNWHLFEIIVFKLDCSLF